MIEKIKTAWQKTSIPVKTVLLSYALIFGATALTIAIFKSSATESSADATSQRQAANKDDGTEDTAHNKNRLYESHHGNTKTLYLVDEHGDTIKSVEIDSSAAIKTVLDNGGFLLQDTEFGRYEDVAKYNYYYLDHDGLEVVEPPEGVRDGNMGLVNIYPAGEEWAVFNRVTNQGILGDEYEAEMVLWNVVTGEEKIIKDNKINKYDAYIASVSSDRKTINFVGVSPEQQAATKQRILDLTNGELTFEDDSRLNEIYGWETKVTIIKLDVSTGETLVSHEATLDVTYNGNYHLSPDAKHIVYRDNEDGVGYYVDVVNDRKRKLGETRSLHGVSYSPSSTSLVYSTNASSENPLEEVKVIELGDLTISVVDTTKEQGDSKKYPGKNTTFLGTRWFSDNRIEYSKLEVPHEYDTKTKQVSKKNLAPGSSVGILFLEQ